MDVMEKHLHIAITKYIRLQYPNILFRSDYGAGAKLTMGQAKAQREIQNGMKWPDLFIAEPRHTFNGLFIELKDAGVKIRKKNGEWANPHIKAQAECMGKLQDKGYLCCFAIGWNEAKTIIDEYLM